MESEKGTAAQTRRFGGWWMVAVAALLAVLWFSPQQGSVLIYKVSQLSIGVLMAYWADRVLFRHAPNIDATLPKDTVGAARLIARAIVALAIILGLTIGI